MIHLGRRNTMHKQTLIKKCKILRGSVLTPFFLLLNLTLVSPATFAQNLPPNFPDKPIRLIITTPAGSGVDAIGRALAQGLTEITRQQVIVDNRAGAGGIIGATAIANAAPDGYTIGIAATAHIVSPLLQAKPAYHPINDFTPIAQLTVIPNIVVTSLKNNVKNLKDLIDLTKRKPDEINYGSLGDGTASHLSAEIVNRSMGMKTVHVPYRTIADSYTGLWSGDVQYEVYLMPSALPLFQGGRALAIANTGRTRSPALPDVPTVRELGYPEAESEITIGIVAPSNLSPALVQKLHQLMVEAMKLPDVREKMSKQGGQPSPELDTKAYDQRLKLEYETYKKLISTIGLKPQ
jgi:tripartite-type tricarboxylate transporter receptor subunit TctC